MCEMSPEPIYIGPLLTGKGLQHVIMPGRCRNGRGEMAFAATARVRHTGGGNAVRPRRWWLMSTERHQVASCAATPSSSKEVDDAVGFPPVGRRV